MKQIAFGVLACLLAQSAMAQQADDCRSKLRDSLEVLRGRAIARANLGQHADSSPTHFHLVFEDALKAMDDPKHKIDFPDDHRSFIPMVVKGMHDPSCDDYATKTLNAMLNQN
jgi:hypothetical protein